jgi:hypothetical protein
MKRILSHLNPVRPLQRAVQGLKEYGSEELAHLQRVSKQTEMEAQDIASRRAGFHERVNCILASTEELEAHTQRLIEENMQHKVAFTSSVASIIGNTNTQEAYGDRATKEQTERLLRLLKEAMSTEGDPKASESPEQKEEAIASSSRQQQQQEQQKQQQQLRVSSQDNPKVSHAPLKSCSKQRIPDEEDWNRVPPQWHFLKDTLARLNATNRNELSARGRARSQKSPSTTGDDRSRAYAQAQGDVDPELPDPAAAKEAVAEETSSRRRDTEMLTTAERRITEEDWQKVRRALASLSQLVAFPSLEYCRFPLLLFSLSLSKSNRW